MSRWCSRTLYQVSAFSFHLFERERLGSLLGGSRLPHADGGAGAAGDNQLRVWTYGTEDLTPLGQTLIHHQRLKPEGRQIRRC